MKSKVGIIGKGHVGGALKSGLEKAGYEVQALGRGGAREAASWGDILILAAPFSEINNVLGEIEGLVAGKVLIDTSNALTKDYQLALGFTTSGAEEMQKKVRSAKVVKCFNTVFASCMSTGKTKGQQVSVFVAGDDEKARETTLQLARDIGFDAVDSGPLRNARWLETLGYLNIQLGFTQKMGTEIGFKLVH